MPWPNAVADRLVAAVHSEECGVEGQDFGPVQAPSADVPVPVRSVVCGVAHQAPVPDPVLLAALAVHLERTERSPVLNRGEVLPSLREGARLAARDITITVDLITTTATSSIPMAWVTAAIGSIQLGTTGCRSTQPFSMALQLWSMATMSLADSAS